MCILCELNGVELGTDPQDQIPEEGRSLNDFLAENFGDQPLTFTDPAPSFDRDTTLAEDAEEICECVDCALQRTEDALAITVGDLEEADAAINNLDDLLRYLHFGVSYIRDNPEGAEYVAAYLAESVNIDA